MLKSDTPVWHPTINSDLAARQRYTVYGNSRVGITLCVVCNRFTGVQSQYQLTTQISIDNTKPAIYVPLILMPTIQYSTVRWDTNNLHRQPQLPHCKIPKASPTHPPHPEVCTPQWGTRSGKILSYSYISTTILTLAL